MLSKARAFTSMAHHHHQHLGSQELDSKVSRTGLSLLELAPDQHTLLSLSANDTVEFWLELPEALRGAGGVERHIVHSSLRLELLHQRAPTPAELAALGSTVDAEAACQRAQRMAASAELDTLMRAHHVRTTSAELPGATVLLQELWGGEAASHTSTYAHHDDIFPEGTFTAEQLQQRHLSPNAAAREPVPSALVEVHASAKMSGTEVLAAMTEAMGVVHMFMHALAHTSEYPDWAAGLIETITSFSAVARGMQLVVAVPDRRDLERLPTMLLDEIVPFSADGDDTFIMTARYAAEVVVLLRGGTPSYDGLSDVRKAKLQQLFEITRSIASDMNDQFGSIQNLERFEGKLLELVPALGDVVLAVNDLRDAMLPGDVAAPAVQEEGGKSADAQGEDHLRKATIARVVEELTVKEKVHALAHAAEAAAVDVQDAARAAQLALSSAVDQAKQLYGGWDDMLAKLASLVNIELLNRRLSKSFGSEKFLKSTFLMEAALAIEGSKHQDGSHEYHAEHFAKKKSADEGDAAEADTSLKGELMNVRAALSSRVALEMSGFGQSGEVLALALSPKVSMAHGITDFKPVMRLLGVSLPLSFKAASLGQALAKALVHRFAVKLLTSDSVQRFVMARATKLISRSLKRETSILQVNDARFQPGTLAYAFGRVSGLMSLPALLADGDAAQLPMKESMVGRGFSNLRAVANVIAHMGPLLSGSLARLVRTGESGYEAGILAWLHQLRSDLGLEEETPAAMAAAATSGRRRSIFDTGSVVGAIMARPKPRHAEIMQILTDLHQVVSQVSAKEMLTGLEQLKEGANVDVATAEIVTRLCKLAGRDCALTPGTLSADAAAKLGDASALYTDIVAPALQLAARQMHALLLVATAAGEAMHSRIAPRQIVDEEAFAQAAAAMRRVAETAQVLRQGLPGSPNAQAWATEASEFLEQVAAADFDDKQQLVKCTVGLMQTFTKSVVFHVQRSHSLDRGVCSMVGYFGKLKAEVDATGCLAYLQEQAGRAPQPTEPPPKTVAEQEEAEDAITFQRLYRGILVPRAILQLLESGCNMYSSISKLVDGYADVDESTFEKGMSTKGTWDAVHDELHKSLSGVGDALQAFGMERNSAPMRVVGMMRKLVSRIDKVNRAFAASPCPARAHVHLGTTHSRSLTGSRVRWLRRRRCLSAWPSR